MHLHSREDFGFCASDIKENLEKYYTAINNINSMKSKILGNWESVEAYVDTLFWLKYEKKYTYRQIGEILNVKQDYVSSIYRSLPFGWHYSTNNFEETLALEQHDLEKVSSLIGECTENNAIFSSAEYMEYYSNCEGKIANCTLKKLHYDENTFLKILYYLYIEKELSKKEISLGLDTTYAKIDRIISKILNISVSPKEAQQRVARNNRRDYNRVYKRGRETGRRFFYETGLKGSIAENMFRTLLEERAIEFLPPNQYSVIVGINNRTIIYPYEVDIPLIIYNELTGEEKRFAVEFNGTFWHDDNKKSDIEKSKKLNQLNWFYIGVDFTDYDSNNPNIFFQKTIENVFNYIKDLFTEKKE